VFDENSALIASWTYNLFFEWDTSFSSGNPINEDYRPINLKVPLVIMILFIIILRAAVFAVSCKNMDHNPSVASLRKYSFIPFFLVILTVFYIVVFPLLYLLPNELFFPSLTNIDVTLEYTFSYSISFGYIFQLCGFVLIFPYSIYYYMTITELEKRDHTPEVEIDKIIGHVQEKLNLDKYIAEEQEVIRRK
jgi:hypothetical protein